MSEAQGRLAVLGAGAWGTALAAVLAARHRVTLWARDPTQAEDTAHARRNLRYLPEITLPDALHVTAELPAALEGAELVVAATPVAGLRELLGRLVAAGRTAPLIWLCKGFEQTTGMLPHQVVDQVLGSHGRGAAAGGGVLSGPSFALEVARHLPCALTLAAREPEFARATAALMHGRRLRVYYSDDVVGVEVGGAVKNVIAIAAGICDGLGLGQNARAALITRGLAEVTRLGIALGGRPETFMGLAGIGDLILTATGDLSRNRRVGLELAHGRRLAEVLAGLGHVAEGVRSAAEVARLGVEHGVEMPITEAVRAVLEERLAAPAAAELLLARDPKREA